IGQFINNATATRMITLAVDVLGHKTLLVRQLYTSAETRQPARSIKTDRLPSAQTDGPVRANSTQSGPFDTDIPPGVIKITFHMIVINVQVATRFQRLKGLADTGFLVLGGCQLVKTVAA